MAKTPTNNPSSDEEWTDVNRGLGTAILLEEKGDFFVGFFLGTKEGIETDDKFHPGSKRLSTALQLAPEEDPEGLWFIWQNGILENAFVDIAVGTKVRIIYEGVEPYTDKKTGQPRQAKRYRVQVAGRK